jgi:anaerobic magnesium-protoporphyrin IX monomethyl ester cyclase
MKLLFIQSDPFAWIGKMSISAVLKQAGHECKLLIEPAEKNLMKAISSENPDIVAFSATTGTHIWALERAKEIKEKLGLPVLFGGPHATYFPEIVENKNVDIVCIGEGEYAVKELFDKIKNKEDITKIKNLWVKKDDKIYKNEIRPLIQELDSLPFPDRSLYYEKYDFLKNQNSREFIIMRGCPYQCSFCYNHSLQKMYHGKGNYVRYKNVNRAIEEIIDVKNEWGLGSAMFFDEVMFLNKEWLFTFLKQYKEKIDVPFACEARANLLDEDICKNLKKAGCICVRIGVESGSNEIRNKILKKNLNNEQIEKAARLIKQETMLLETYNMVGLPRETLEDAFETLSFNKKIKADYGWCSIYQPYPKTDLAELAVKDGILDKEYWNDLEPSFFVTTKMRIENRDEIINLQKFFALAIRFNISNSLIKWLIKMPPNRIYNLFFKAGYVYLTLKTTRIGIKGIYKLGKLTKNYFEKRVNSIEASNVLS